MATAASPVRHISIKLPYLPTSLPMGVVSLVLCLLHINYFMWQKMSRDCVPTFTRLNSISSLLQGWETEEGLMCINWLANILEFKQLSNVCFSPYGWPNTVNYENNIKKNPFFTHVFWQGYLFYIYSRLCKTFKKESIQLQPSEFLLKKEEGFLELLGAVFLSGRIRISWENVLRVKCPGSD